MQTTYELMIKTNYYLIKGGILTEKQRHNITQQLLSAVSNEKTAARFYTGVKYPGNTDGDGRRMYPVFYIPPYNDGKKYQTVMTQTPKTHILSANAYELEILRLLCLLTPDDATVRHMTAQTLLRLKTTCFGNADDGVGECFDTSLIVLRFLASAAPDEALWMTERIMNFHRHFSEKRRHWGAQWYFYLCITEMPFDIAQPEILLYKEEIVRVLSDKSCVMNSEQDKTIHPVLYSILRNILARLPEYAYIKDREPYISAKDGRLHFDMRETL